MFFFISPTKFMQNKKKIKKGTNKKNEKLKWNVRKLPFFFDIYQIEAFI